MNDIITIDGVNYENVERAAEAVGLSEDVLSHLLFVYGNGTDHLNHVIGLVRLQAASPSDQAGSESPTEKNVTVERHAAGLNGLVVNGESYSSLRAAARSLGVNHQALWKMLKKHGSGTADFASAVRRAREKAMLRDNHVSKGPTSFNSTTSELGHGDAVKVGKTLGGPTKKPVTVKGVEYPMQRDAAKACGLPANILCTYVKKYGSGSKALDDAVDRYRPGVYSPSKPVTVKGIEYPTHAAAAAAVCVPATVFYSYARKYGSGSKALDDAVDRYKPGRTGLEKPVVVNGVEHSTQAAAANACGMPSDVFGSYVKKYGAYSKALDDAVDRFLAGRRIVWQGVTYSSATRLAEYLNNPFLSAANITEAIRNGDLAGAIRRASAQLRKQTVNGEVYPSAIAFAQAHNLDVARVRSAVGAGNSFSEVLRIMRPDMKVEKASDRISDDVAVGKTVTMSGWVWPSRKAFKTYYDITAKIDFEDERGVAVHAMEHLCRHYQWGNLLPNNRLVPEREKKLPKWALPFDRPRGEPLNFHDREATPDWAVNAAGERHEFFLMRKESNLEKTARQVLLGEEGQQARNQNP